MTTESVYNHFRERWTSPEQRQQDAEKLQQEIRDLNLYIGATLKRVARWGRAEQQAFYEATGCLPEGVSLNELYSGFPPTRREDVIY